MIRFYENRILNLNSSQKACVKQTMSKCKKLHLNSALKSILYPVSLHTRTNSK